MSSPSTSTVSMACLQDDSERPSLASGRDRTRAPVGTGALARPRFRRRGCGALPSGGLDVVVEPEQVVRVVLCLDLGQPREISAERAVRAGGGRLVAAAGEVELHAAGAEGAD